MAKNKYAIDFGSARTNIYKLGSGLVLSEPTVAAVCEENNKCTVKFIGNEASKLIGKTSKNTKIVFPIFEGEVVNEYVASGVLSGLLKKIGFNRFSSNSAVFSVPCGANSEMIEKLTRVAKNVGLGRLFFVESPMLVALGQRVPINDSSPCFIIDIAGGTTSIAALSLNGIIAGVSVNFGGNKISTDIIDFIEENYGLQIGLLTAERLKKELSSLDENDGLATVVNGRDMQSGSPKSISIKACEIFEPISKFYDKIAEISNDVLKKLPPEVSAEIRYTGLYVSGEASKVYGIENYFSKKFNMKITVCENPSYCAALGGGIAIGNQDILKKIFLTKS